MTYNVVTEAAPRDWLKSFLLNAVKVVGFGLLTAVCAKIKFYIPGSLVPITFQSFAVLLAGACLGSFRGSLSQVMLIAFGASGLSVFSISGPGTAAFLGPTGGYILGFIFAAYVAGWMSEKIITEYFWIRAVHLFLASLFIFIPGVVWYSVYTNQSLMAGIYQGFLPFIIGDVVKVLAVAGCVHAFKTVKR